MNPPVIREYKALKRDKREKIFERDGGACRTCGDNQYILEVHHISAYVEGGSERASNLVTLCRKCHKKFEGFDGLLRKVLSGKMTLEKFLEERKNLTRAYHNSAYRNGKKPKPVNIPCTADEHARITSTTSGAQRLAVLLRLCDDIDAVMKG